jgi:phage-related minor tail protein
MTVNAGTVYIDVKPNMATFNTSFTTQSRGLFSSLGSTMSGMSKALIAIPIAGAIIAGIGGMVSALGDWTKLAETAAAEGRVAAGLFRKDADKAVLKWKLLVRWTGVFGNSINQDDEAVQQLIARMVSFLDIQSLTSATGEDPAEFVQRLTKLVYDSAVAWNKSETVTEKLWETVLTNFGKGLPLATKYLHLTDQQVKAYEKLAKQEGETAAGLQLMEDAQKKVRGSARDATTESQKLSRAWENFKEFIGEKLLPVMEPVLSSLRDFLERLTRGTKDFGDVWKRAWEKLVENWNTVIKPTLLKVWSEDIIPVIKALWDGLLSWMSDRLRSWAATALSYAGPLGWLISKFSDGIGDVISELGPGVVPGLASGGIVTRPTLALIGEAGPEAVIPLSQMQRGPQTLRILDWKTGLVELSREFDWNDRGPR